MRIPFDNVFGSKLSGLAPRHGFEPRFTAPKAAVLPLDDRGMGAGLLLNQCSVLYAAPATINLHE